MKYLLLLIPFLFIGCAKNKQPSTTQPAQTSTQPELFDAKTIAALAALELSEKPKNRVILKEVSDALDVFCNEQQIDSLALVGLLKSKLGGFKNRRRVAMFLLLLDRAGAEINPSDYVQWGGLSCKIREGIKYGLAFE